MKLNINPEDLANEVIEIRRVGKVTRGGKRLRFRVVAVVGDRQGHVGVGFGKSVEIPQAIQQAIRDASKSMVRVALVNGTIPHEVVGVFKASRVLLKPAYPGTGVIAGRTVGAVCRLAGLDNILTKSLGTNTPLNLARATALGLGQSEPVEAVAARRGKSVEDLVEVEEDAQAG
ncbi:MAG: 30S ribosomal protein S5 [Candidatus Bipolaricaulota bacterium]